MADFIIALMLCAGTNCEMVQPEPDTSYPTYEACTDATNTKAPALETFLKQHPPGNGRQASVVCVSQKVTVVEVEEPQEARDTELVHAEPSATSGYVGVIEKGARTLVTGRVPGTQWLRVLLKDGSSGFVFSDHLRKLESSAATNPPPTPPSPSAPAITALPTQKATTLPPPQAAPAPIASAPIISAPITSAPIVSAQTGSLVCNHCPAMVALPAGTLTMGSNDDSTEKPIHKVTIAAFMLGRSEVTLAEWTACATEGACHYKPPPADSDPALIPMANISVTDAAEYLAWLKHETGKPYRLPSEAEWEYAARAGATTRYYWGDQIGTGHADCEGCGGAHDSHMPQHIGLFPANRFGLVGMAGGVAEWVEDCWHMNYQGAPTDGSAWFIANCAQHVLRGGSWRSGPRDVTVSSRNYYDTSVRYLTNGMRVALSTK